jgi:hypothetical protein
MVPQPAGGQDALGCRDLLLGVGRRVLKNYLKYSYIHGKVWQVGI